MTPYKDLIGTIVIPILGAVPEGFMVLFSGLGSNPQATAGIGIGTLAGSSIMLLTINWAMVIVAGRVDINNGVCNYNAKDENDNDDNKDKSDPKLTRPYDIMNTGCENNSAIHSKS